MKSCILAGLLSIGAIHLAVAQEPVPEPVIEEEEDRSDAPSRVARLSYTDGEVTLAPAGSEDWAEAVLNRPLTNGDRVWVERGGRAELQIGSSSVHLDGSTGFSFIDLSDDILQMELTEGAVVVHVRRKLQSERIEIDTPNAVVSLLHPGEYHIRVNEYGDETVVRVRSGESEIDGERESYSVRAGEQGIFKGSGEITADIKPLDSRTAFEKWANDREARDARSSSARYVSRDVIGYEDLDEHGDWVREPEYGYVWRPRYVVSGWAPYRDGRWVWVSPWGWTWVDASPWGFAPFHYGRWAYVQSRWCWVPGPRHLRPVYAPALVGWVGGPNLSVSVSFGSGVGWFPLGPREVYVPGYWHSRRYIRNVNVTNTVIVNNTYITRIYEGRRHGSYRYRDHANAVTAVQREAFVSGAPLHGRHLRMDERQLREWRHDPRPPAIAPERHSLLAGRQVNRALPRFEQRSREIATRRAIPTRVSFDAERRAIEANGARPIARSQLFAGQANRDANRSGSNLAGRGAHGRDAPASTRPEFADGNRSPGAVVPRDRAEAGVKRADRTGERVQQYRNREAPKQSVQPNVARDRSEWAARPNDNRTEPSSVPAAEPRNSEWRARRDEERGSKSRANILSTPQTSLPAAQDNWQRDSRMRESRVEAPRQEARESVFRERANPSVLQRQERAPQQRAESMRAPEPPRAQPQRAERSMPERQSRSQGSRGQEAREFRK